MLAQDKRAAMAALAERVALVPLTRLRIELPGALYPPPRRQAVSSPGELPPPPAGVDRALQVPPEFALSAPLSSPRAAVEGIS